MWQCHYCRGPLSSSALQKNRMCPNCGSDLVACANCIHFDPSTPNQCREPDSPWIKDRNTQNSCPYFEFRPAPRPDVDSPGVDINSEAERAKEAFRALFRD